MTTELSKLLTSCLTAVRNMLSSIVKRYMRDQVNPNLGLLKNSGEILDKLKARDFNAASMSTYDVSTLYTTLPHNLIKDKLVILLKEPSREKAHLTLHIMTEMHFLLQKN